MRLPKLRRVRGRGGIRSQSLPPHTTFPFAHPHWAEFDGIVFFSEYELRLARCDWMKSKFGKEKIPLEFFVVVLNADVTLDLLDRWFKYGGLPHIWRVCSALFPHDEVASQLVTEKMQTLRTVTAEYKTYREYREAVTSGTYNDAENY